MGNGHYQVEFEDFKGPAHVLLELVRKRKIDIYQVRLSDIISDFLEYISIQKEVLLDTLSSFLYIASILLEIKSNSIIPSQNRDKDDEDPELAEPPHTLGLVDLVEGVEHGDQEEH